jgi:hypothetical protein
MNLIFNRLFLVTALVTLFAILLTRHCKAEGFSLSDFEHATNYTAVGYMTHFDNNNRQGGGAMLLYNFNGFTGAGVGADWAGQWRLFTANLNVHYTYHLNDNWSITGYGIAAIGATSRAGGDTGSEASGYGAGAYLSHKGKYGIGGNYITRQNCGNFSGGSEAITIFKSF